MPRRRFGEEDTSWLVAQVVLAASVSVRLAARGEVGKSLTTEMNSVYSFSALFIIKLILFFFMSFRVERRANAAKSRNLPNGVRLRSRRFLHALVYTRLVEVTQRYKKLLLPSRKRLVFAFAGQCIIFVNKLISGASETALSRSATQFAHTCGSPW